MVRRGSGSDRLDKTTSIASAPSAAEARRIDRLAEVVDACLAAKREAEDLGEKFLAYLLAMAIEETRAGMRNEVAAAAHETTKHLGPRRRS